MLTFVSQFEHAIEAGNEAQALAIARANPGMVHDILPKAKRTPLQLAIDRGSDVLVHGLLEAGADPNRMESGRAPIWTAFVSGHATIALRLLDAGSSIDVSSLCFFVANSKNFTENQVKRLLPEFDFRTF